MVEASPEQLTLIEIDRDLGAQLANRFPQANLLTHDVLTVSLEEFTHRRIVGNLPYNISTPLLVRMFDAESIVDMHLMLQREVALRLAAVPGEKAWGRLSVIVQYRYHVEALFPVVAESFHPVPKVESMFIRLRPNVNEFEAADTELFKNIVKTAFSQRRKTLENSLREFRIAWDSLDLDSRMRADHISVRDYVNIANHVYQQ